MRSIFKPIMQNIFPIKIVNYFSFKSQPKRYFHFKVKNSWQKYKEIANL